MALEPAADVPDQLVQRRGIAGLHAVQPTLKLHGPRRCIGHASDSPGQVK